MAPDFAALQAGAKARLLTISCTLASAADRAPPLPAGARCLLMLSPDEPAFWPGFRASPEGRDGAPDPMDRWSRRVITAWADDLGARALFPFGGPPFNPFIGWALATGQVHSSPVGMLVQQGPGLFVSFRGALALDWLPDLPGPVPSPCTSCADRHCLTACPVNALGPDGYKVPDCKAFLATDAGRDCMARGCAARRACPAGRDHGRLAAHSSFHMRHFLAPDSP